MHESAAILIQHTPTSQGKQVKRESRENGNHKLDMSVCKMFPTVMI